MTTESSDPDLEIARIKGRISGFINEKLDEGKIAYFSQLGSHLGEDRIRLENLTGMKLARFVHANFSYKIREGGQHKNILFISPPETLAPLSGSLPRYLPRFWAAFAVPLRERENRFIDVETCEFGPKESLASVGRDLRPIAPEYVARPEMSGSSAETVERISRWLNTQGLESERYRLRPHQPRSSGETLFDQILSVLDHDQLRRTTLPLDVIKSLFDRRS